uniref:Uncharacterized protein n=1 Tax=Lutzomyia longipalpis TaxID=7200 RepID=A0A1B0CJA6_LUTLO
PPVQLYHIPVALILGLVDLVVQENLEVQDVHQIQEPLSILVAQYCLAVLVDRHVPEVHEVPHLLVYPEVHHYQEVRYHQVLLFQGDLVSHVGLGGRPTEPRSPVSPLAPATPGAPGIPGGPKGPCCPGTPCGPLSPVLPTSPGGPIFPGRPSGPTSPGRPGGPCGPGTPGCPATPTGPILPGVPDSPVGPLNPLGPTGPTAPEGPGCPVGPIAPASPFNPSAPIQVDQLDQVDLAHRENLRFLDFPDLLLALGNQVVLEYLEGLFLRYFQVLRARLEFQERQALRVLLVLLEVLLVRQGLVVPFHRDALVPLRNLVFLVLHDLLFHQQYPVDLEVLATQPSLELLDDLLNLQVQGGQVVHLFLEFQVFLVDQEVLEILLHQLAQMLRVLHHVQVDLVGQVLVNLANLEVLVLLVFHLHLEYRAHQVILVFHAFLCGQVIHVHLVDLVVLHHLAQANLPIQVIHVLLEVPEGLLLHAFHVFLVDLHSLGAQEYLEDLADLFLPLLQNLLLFLFPLVVRGYLVDQLHLADQRHQVVLWHQESLGDRLDQHVLLHLSHLTSHLFLANLEDLALLYVLDGLIHLVGLVILVIL